MDSPLTDLLPPIWVPADAGGDRLDRFLALQFPNLSRARIQDLIAQGYVQVNGQPCRSKKTLLKEGDCLNVVLPAPQPMDLTPEPIPLEVLYEDDNLVILNKPAGMVVHPAAGHERGTLVHALLSHCPQLSGINGVQRPGIVHRLDKDTSGAIMIAKTDFVHQHLQQQIQAKTAQRHYLGIITGVPKTSTGTIMAPIGRHPRDRQRMAIISTGRPAITHWQIQERLGNFSLLRFRLETGRTHQIRVHAAHAGWPIAGDPLYGSRPRLFTQHLPGQALHAAELHLTHPVTGQQLRAIAPLPPGWHSLLAALRR
ncbi:MAG: RluA family pseudouridine synthase [Oscillatoriales cyanobacterium SM2_2_1]|nr:RluA family pseudouridine synthase [Oscillatoriales cyanobacterium SM2_2_1]